MNINQEHLEKILNVLLDAYPLAVLDWGKVSNELGGDTTLIAHLVYLFDCGLIEGEFLFTGSTSGMPWKTNLYKTRINAVGIDHHNNNIKKLTEEPF